MSDQPVVLVVTMEAKPEAADAMRAVLHETAMKSQAEDGCLIYQLLEDRKAPGKFLLMEKWRDSAAFKSHQGSAHLREAFVQLDKLQAAPPAFVPWRAVD